MGTIRSGHSRSRPQAPGREQVIIFLPPHRREASALPGALGGQDSGPGPESGSFRGALSPSFQALPGVGRSPILCRDWNPLRGDDLPFPSLGLPRQGAARRRPQPLMAVVGALSSSFQA